MAEKLVPLTGFEPVTPSLRTWGIHGKLRHSQQRPYLFPQYVPFSFAFWYTGMYSGTSRDGRAGLQTDPPNHLAREAPDDPAAHKPRIRPQQAPCLSG